MRENEKEREELKASRRKTFINEQKVSFPKTKTAYNVSCGGFYSQPLIQNTKKTKSKSYYRGKKREESKKGDKKVKKSKQQDK